jgi:hypothetical protein
VSRISYLNFVTIEQNISGVSENTTLRQPKADPYFAVPAYIPHRSGSLSL